MDRFGRFNRMVLAGMAVLCLGAGCSGSEDSAVLARFALDIPEAGATESDDLLDAAGLYVLESWPAFVSVVVTGDDMEAQKALWPETPSQLTPGPTEVDLEVPVDPGGGRAVEAVAFLFEEQRPLCFVQTEPVVLDLSPGKTTELEIELVQAETGTVYVSAPGDVSKVGLVDLAAEVRLATAPVTSGEAAFEFAPIGRDLGLATLGTGGTWTLVPESKAVCHLSSATEECFLDLN